MGVDGPVDTAGRMLPAAPLRVVKRFTMVVEILLGPGGLELRLAGPLDAVPAVAAKGRKFRHGRLSLP